MSRALVQLGPLPRGVTSVLLQWRREDSTVWLDLGSQTGASATWTIPGDGVVRIRAVPKPTGRIRETRFNPSATVEDRKGPKTITFNVLTEVRDGVVRVTPKEPESTQDEEYTTEVRVGKDGDGPENAVYVGEVKNGETIDLTQRPETVTTRPTPISRVQSTRVRT